MIYERDPESPFSKILVKNSSSIVGIIRRDLTGHYHFYDNRRDASNRQILLPEEDIMEPRGYERYSPGKEILAALRLPPERQNWTFMGHIVDLSRSGLSFAYLPIHKVPVKTACEVMLKSGSKPFGEPIACEPVYEIPAKEAGGATSGTITYETQFFSKTYSLPLMRRCAVKFLNPLSFSDA